MKVVIVPYDKTWPVMFEQEKERLEKALSHHALSIQHIGSTAVPGLSAKPIIDIMIAVRTLAEADEFCIQPIIGMGYEYGKELERETPFRRYFRKSNEMGVRTHHIHMVGIDSDWWANNLLFRDYLRANAAARQAYEAHKRLLAEREWETGYHYAKAKTDFILKMMEQARSWRQRV